VQAGACFLHDGFDFPSQTTMIRKLHSIGPLGIFLLAVGAFALSFAISYVWAAQNDSHAQVNALMTPLGSDKDQDGLIGPVNRVRTETAKLTSQSGKLTEGSRELLELTTYDTNGKRIDNSYFLVSINSRVGKEEYAHDDKGNVREMTLRDDAGSILNREIYSYEYDAVGNWTKMITNTVVYEGGKVTPQPTEISYRSISYYFDQAISEIVEANPSATGASADERSGQGNLASLNRAFESWIDATNARDINKVMKFYGAEVEIFYRARNVTDEFVREDKLRSFRRADALSVRAENPEVTIGRDESAASMRFVKEYSVTIKGRERRGKVIQQLRWQRTREGWKIVSERDVRVIR
jgi:hypothetical protein